MAGVDKQILARSIQLADQVIENADLALSFQQECIELKTKAEKLADLLRKAARARNSLLDRPTRRIVDYSEHVLDEALTLVIKCCHTGCLMRILFITIPPSAFKNASTELQNSIENVCWILSVSTPLKDPNDEYLGLPPIASNEPILGLIWERVAILYTGTLEERSGAAASLASLASKIDRYGELIVEEGGVVGLLKLAKEGQMEGQENAARCIGFLCRNSKSVEQIVNCGACSVFANILEDGHMKVQSLVALAVSEMATHYPKCQDDFLNNNVISLLVNHLAFETIQEQQQQQMGINDELEDDKQTSSCMNHPNENQLCSQMKAMAARALWHLSKGNVAICQNIIESRALLCFASLLEKGLKDVKYNSAMALMEITAMTEQNVDLRKSGFKPNSLAVKAIVEQFLEIIEKENSDLIIPSIKAIGHLAWTFEATESRMICALVKLLDEREVEVTVEALVALDKFASPDNVLHEKHCKGIIEAGGTRQLVQLVYFGELKVGIASLILLCHIVIDVPYSEQLAEDEVLTVVEVALKRPRFMENPNLQSLLPIAANRLSLFQSRASKWISTILFQKECPR